MTNKASKPDWIRVKAPVKREYHATRDLIKSAKLHTVCEEAACPNIGECWAKKHATIMILGSVCTRACRFCNIKTGRPDLLDPHEPERVADTLAHLGLQHVVITSVDRDDLEDGGAEHFAQTIRAIRRVTPQTTIEILTPDFQRKPGALEVVVEAEPDVFNHNVETVPRLYQSVRPGARYFHSVNLLARVKQLAPQMFTKSGLMVGLGEDKSEIYQVMDDFRAADIDFITIGQYLQPTPKHHPVLRYVTPDEFQDYEKMARGKGFLMVSASPLTRSSYHAGEDFERLRAARNQKLGLTENTSPKVTIDSTENIISGGDEQPYGQMQNATHGDADFPIREQAFNMKAQESYRLEERISFDKRSHDTCDEVRESVPSIESLEPKVRF